MRRNKRFLLLIAVVILLPLLSLGCLTTPTAAPSVPADPVAHQSDIASLSGKLNEKASAGSVSALETRMATAEGKITTLQSTSPANTYTKAEVDAAVAAAIAALKANQAWITGSSSSPSTPSGTTTTVSGVSVNLDKNQVISTSTDTGNKDVTVTITNSSGASKTISLLISLTPLSPSAVDDAKLTIYTVKSTLSGFTTAQTGIKQMNPDVSTLIAKIYWVAPDFYLDNGATKTIWLNFDVKSVDVVTWTLGVKAL